MPPLTATFSDRVTQLLGIDIPIVQAPVAWIAPSQLASAVSDAVSKAGAMGTMRSRRGSSTSPARHARCATSQTRPSA